MSQPNGTLHGRALHESGLRHTTGEARYVDDLPVPADGLVATLVPSPHASARIVSRDGTAALAIEGVEAVLFASDIPGSLLVGPIAHDEPLLADEDVHFVGQTVALVLGTSYEATRAGAAAVEVQYEPREPVLTMEEALEAESFHTDPHTIRRGDLEAAMDSADQVVTGTFRNGAQEHFYLETQCALVKPGEDRTFHVHASTQHPTEVQKMVASVLGIGANRVVCDVPRMGGAFGGKESQATQPACLAALGAWHTRRPVKVWLNRDDDMCFTGKRHPFLSKYRAAFADDGQLLALEVDIYADGGWTIDLSPAICDRALFHLDNSYFIETVRFTGRVLRTNLPSNTAFRGFGGPQGMLVVEDAMNRFAERMGRDPLEVRRRNYYGDAPRNVTPYGQTVEDVRIHRMTSELLERSDYVARRAAIEHHNAQGGMVRRGIGFHPVKFGISFTKSILNQAGALVHVYTDGTVQLNHGGTEMGQGLHTKMRAIAAHALGVVPSDVRVMDTATDKVPNTSATAASSGSDLNGQAVREACVTIRERVRPVAAQLLGVPEDDMDALVFAGGGVYHPSEPAKTVPFAAVAESAWLERISLSATGFYRTPGIWYDHSTGRGKPFFYYAYGAAISEVEVNALTGEHRVVRADVLHDVGRSLLPDIDRGQVEGAYVQGLGWLTCEEVLFADDGRLLTPGPSTYKIPAFGDAPLDFRVELLERAPQDGVVHGSKAVGEPPFMLAISAWTALRHAVARFGEAGREVRLDPPATPEAILRAIVSQQVRSEA